MSDESGFVIPEYAQNPFISCLPEIKTRKQIYKTLQFKPEYSDVECGYPSHYRKHFVLRLGRFFEPVSRQLQLAENIDYVIRQGYIGRNPLTHDYIRYLQNDFHRTQLKDIFAKNQLPVENTATSFSIIGCSGVGKSKAIEKILHQYPQTVQHSEPFSLVQIPWIKLDCPHQGSPKQLCKNFFSSVDRLLSTEYEHIYGGAKSSLDEMLVHMAQVANLHALGLLVIDEIQHLRKSKNAASIAGSDQLLNFIVTLVNTIGVPVIVIGTLSAKAILQKDFRQARRGAGFGSVQWDRYTYDKEWMHIVERMWKYQWTKTYTELSNDILDVLYDESQGILDVVVKLFMLTQLKIISINEARGQGEVITAALIRKVAADDFKLIQPMIEALRKNDQNALFLYDDLYDFSANIEGKLNSLGGGNFEQNTPIHSAISPVEDKVSVLIRLGMSEEQAELIAKGLQQQSGADSHGTVIQARTKRQSDNKKDKLSDLGDDDWRKSLYQVSDNLYSAYLVLLDKGAISSPLEDFEVGT